MTPRLSFLLPLALVLLLLGTSSPTSSPHLVQGQTYHSSGVRRGAYMSLYSSRIGSLYLENIGEADLYHILGNATREQMSLDFFAKWRFNALSFYNLHVIFTTGNLTEHLKSYITRCRAIGITNIEATGSKWLQDYDELLEYNTKLVDNEEQRFDGIVTEIEFWMPGYTMADMTKALNYGRSLNIPARGTTNKFYYCTYLGWVKDSDITTIAPLIDYMWPHAYAKDPDTYYGKTEDRIEALVTAVKNSNTINDNSILVTPIFSTESSKYAAGSAWFGGDALQAGGNFSFVEEEYHSDWTAALSSSTTTPPIGLLTGYQWYEYVFFYMLMKDIAPPVTSAPPTTTPTTDNGNKFQTTTAVSPPGNGTCTNQGGAAAGKHSGKKDKFPWWIIALIFGLLCLLMIGLIIYTKRQLGLNTKDRGAQYHDSAKHTLQFDINNDAESLQMFMTRQERARSLNIPATEDLPPPPTKPVKDSPKKEDTPPTTIDKIEPDNLSMHFSDI